MEARPRAYGGTFSHSVVVIVVSVLIVFNVLRPPSDRTRDLHAPVSSVASIVPLFRHGSVCAGDEEFDRKQPEALCTRTWPSVGGAQVRAQRQELRRREFEAPSISSRRGGLSAGRP